MVFPQKKILCNFLKQCKSKMLNLMIYLVARVSLENLTESNFERMNKGSNNI